MIFQCSGVELDTERFSIMSGGQSVSVTPKVFDLLVFLIQHRNRLITREQLLDELWPDRVVLDNVLSNEIKQARAVLGDDGEQQKYIKTIRGRGYEFVGEVREIDSPAGLTAAPANTAYLPDHSPGNLFSRPGTWLVFVALLFAIGLTIPWLKPPSEPGETATISTDEPIVAEPVNIRPNTIAILPFDNRSNLEQDAFFVDGFHDDLITQVSQIKDLSAISRTSVMTYRDSSKSMRTIGNELGAAIIIEGGVQRAGDQVRINVQMIDAVKDEHIWAETYTRELNAQNVFAIQSEIAFAVATTLQAVLSRQEQQDIAKIPTQNIAALEAFFRGRVSMALTTSKGFSEAVKHFQAAVNLDPNFAEAHAQLGLALLEELNYSSLRPQENTALAESAINRALSLNPELSEAYEALALLERNKRNNAAVETAYERALMLKPGNADAIRMFALFKSGWLGQHKQALTLLNAVKLLDPQNPSTLTISSQVLMNLERYEEARAALNTAIASAPDFAEAYRLLGELYSGKLYQHDEAIKAYRQFQFLDPDTAFNLLHLATAYDELGDSNQAVHFYELYLESDQDWVWPYIARVRLHLVRGEQEQVKRVFKEIKGKFSGKDPWIDVMLSGFDLQQGNPALVIERIETFYPQLILADPENLTDPYWFRLPMVYAAALHLTGEKERAAPWTERILEILPTTSRRRWNGIQTLDTWLHVAMGNDEKALQSLREWREIGARLDLTKHRMVPDSLFDNPEFRALNNEILAELAEQRANLARMEAAGELAPIPEIPIAQ